VASLYGILHRDALRRLVDDRTFERGQAYVAEGRVAELTRDEHGLVATVKGAEPYRVEIRVRGDALAYSCSCPVGAEGSFCKHGVAVVLAWLAEAAPEALPRRASKPPEPPPHAEIDALAAALEPVPREKLRAMLLDEAATDVELCRRFARRLRP